MTARFLLSLAAVGALTAGCDYNYNIGVPDGDQPDFVADVELCTLDLVDDCKPDKPGGLKDL